MKRFLFTVTFAMLVCTSAFAGVLETITSIGGSIGNIFTQHPITSLIVAAVLIAQRMVPDDKMKELVGKPCRNFGKYTTGALTKVPYLGPVWNQTIEAFVIKLVRNVFIEGIEQWIDGMLSDNQ